MSRREGSLTLGDGRRLSYAQWGPAGAVPVFYCHGFPGSHAEGELLQPGTELLGVNVRLIALDRPGFGASTFQHGRSILDWAADVNEAANLLSIDQFAVLGVSGGGPYALACGHALKDRVTSVGVAVGIAPREAPGMDTAAIARTSRRWLVRRVQFALAAYAMKAGREERFLNAAIATMASVDREMLAAGRAREIFAATMTDAFAQGGRGAAHEAGLYRKPHGFDLAQIVAPTFLWYGAADETVPAQAGRWLADQIPGSRFVLWPDHGHLTWSAGREATDVLATLTAPV